MGRQPELLYNPSPSAPIGWYRLIQTDTYSVGDLVAAYLPEEAETLASERGYLPLGLPIIKTIAAIEGDRYCIRESRLEIDGNLNVTMHPLDSQGRAMPVMPERCEVIEDGYVLLISERINRSFDSRYFGQIPVDSILGRVAYLGNDAEIVSSEFSGLGGARGLGAQGKIKAHSANRPLRPCLHINFYSAISMEPALGFSYFPIFSIGYLGAISHKILLYPPSAHAQKP